MEENVTFVSNGLRLSGVIHIPNNLASGETRPAICVLHGFGSNKESSSSLWPARTFSDWGYITLRFDMRSCGESEGEKNHINCLEQVEDTKNAITYLRSRVEVDRGRVGLIGSSFGAAVAVYTAGVDRRVAATISSGGWGDGARKFKNQHVGADAWKKFRKMLDRGRKQRAETGKPLMVPRYDIVPMPKHLRKNLAPGSIMMFPVDTAISMYEFVADEVVGNISPRPLLLLHSSEDSVTPTEQSVELFRRSGNPTDLHLMADVDHFMFTEDDRRVVVILKEWLGRYFPLKAVD
jgi:pimeloyl-ACP methyl ester carboxylesterase